MLELDSIGTLVSKEASKGPFFINKRLTLIKNCPSKMIQY